MPAGTPGLDRRAAVPQDGLARVGHARPALRRLPRARRPTCSASEGAGFRQFLAILDDGRIAIAALAVGLAQACLEHSVAYAKERQAFGGPIGRNQAVAFKCADLAVMVETARLLTYKAAWLKDTRPAVQAGGGDGQAVRDRGRGHRDA